MEQLKTIDRGIGFALRFLAAGALALLMLLVAANILGRAAGMAEIAWVGEGWSSSSPGWSSWAPPSCGGRVGTSPSTCCCRRCRKASLAGCCACSSRCAARPSR
ncbi:hypothetical protein [Teichococcus aestuarii]|uniref:hypothetical protein n=1 Tax=Teichococcus aestuarii TaxID=568898 RepID=UPI00360DEDE5